MALGAVDALASPSPVTRSTVVVGLAVSVVDLLLKLHRGREVVKRKQLKATVHETGQSVPTA